MNFILYALGLLYFMLPAYVANMMPVFARKIPILGSPIDMGKRYRGFRLLGKKKTWRGLIAVPPGCVVSLRPRESVVIWKRSQ